MPECEYCGETVDDGEPYLRHLEDAHEGELGPVDERRLAEAALEPASESSGVTVALLGMLLVTGLLALGYLLAF